MDKEDFSIHELETHETKDISDSHVNGELTVVSNDPAGDQIATQSGEGEYISIYEQTWDNPVNPPSDIMFSVDLSCSMDDDAARLAGDFSNFIGQLSNYSTDWSEPSSQEPKNHYVK